MIFSSFSCSLLDSLRPPGQCKQAWTATGRSEQIKDQNPTKSFVFIFQSTKNGKFRGANSFQHDVDIVIEVPEKGKLSRWVGFNQGREISIF